MEAMKSWTTKGTKDHEGFGCRYFRVAWRLGGCRFRNCATIRSLGLVRQRLIRAEHEADAGAFLQL